MAENSTSANSAAKSYTITAAQKALTAHLKRVNLTGEVFPLETPNIFRIKYKIDGEPLISILIPNKDHFEDLEKCINSIISKTTYQNIEIIVIENNSSTPEIVKYYKKLTRMNIKVVNFKEKKFNFSAINNFGRTFANGEYLIFLNNDIEIITPDWVQEMLMLCQRKNVGAVGAKLYYPDNTIQHAGVILGLGGVAGHSHKNFQRNDPGNFGKLLYCQNMSAVTAACMMIKTEVFDKIGQFDEQFAVAFNDVDLCMKVRKFGYFILWTPFADAYHFESKSRGLDNLPQKQKRFQQEVLLFRRRYRLQLLAGDPYYNPNLTLAKEDYSIL
jgi:GT2 family glycosyltransferase